MKQVCLLCQRTSPDSNLYCQETYCPAEMSPNILGYGEWLGDIEIVKAIAVLRSAALYEAMHQGQRVLLKVAHPGRENTERLKREAEFLRDIQLKRDQNEFLPVLLPPYANTTIKVDAYGKAMLGGHLLYFCLFEFVEGEPLRDVLTKHPQLWINHIGWLMISLASATAFVQSKGMFHFGLTPESVLLKFDIKQNVPRILLFDLGIISDGQNIGHNWHPFAVSPAYTAPELITDSKIRPDYRTDVYGLGLTLYELLVSEPAFHYKLNSDEEVYKAVLRNRRIRMNRVEDVKSVANIALKASDQLPNQRYQNAAEVTQELLAYFGPVPGRKKSRWPKLKTLMVVVGALLTIAFLITIAVTLNEFVVL